MHTLCCYCSQGQTSARSFPPVNSSEWNITKALLPGPDVSVFVNNSALNSKDMSDTWTAQLRPNPAPHYFSVADQGEVVILAPNWPPIGPQRRWGRPYHRKTQGQLGLGLVSWLLLMMDKDVEHLTCIIIKLHGPEQMSTDCHHHFIITPPRPSYIFLTVFLSPSTSSLLWVPLWFFSLSSWVNLTIGASLILLPQILSLMSHPSVVCSLSFWTTHLLSSSFIRTPLIKRL